MLMNIRGREQNYNIILNTFFVMILFDKFVKNH